MTKSIMMLRLAGFAAVCMAAAAGVVIYAPTAHATASSTFNGVCMQTATTALDTALISAVQTHSTAVVAALNARTSDLNAAWVMTDTAAMKSAVKAAVRKYHQSLASAGRTARQARLMAWRTFSDTAKNTCGATMGMFMSSVDNNLNF